MITFHWYSLLKYYFTYQLLVSKTKPASIEYRHVSIPLVSSMSWPIKYRDRPGKTDLYTLQE